MTQTTYRPFGGNDFFNPFTARFYLDDIDALHMTYDADVAITLWPEYFDINRTRAEGRRLPKDLCVENPDLDIIAKGAMILDLEYEIMEDMSYPKSPRDRHGCVRVERGIMSKTELLPKIGEILVQNSKK